MSKNVTQTTPFPTVAGHAEENSPNQSTIGNGTEDDEGGMFVVDDDGVPIDPAAEGSFMMAEGLSLLLTAQHGGAEDSQGGLVLEPYVPDFDVDEARAKSKAFFSRHNSAAMDVPPPSVPAPSGDAAIAGPRPAVETEENSDEDYADDEEDQYDDEEEEEDDLPAMGSRDMTDPDDWVLEAILKRRMNKEAPAGGPWVYWCKWKGHKEPTWETREVMEEAGWIPQLDAYDARGVRHNMKKQKDRNAIDWSEYDDAESGKKKYGCRKQPKAPAPFHLSCEAMDRLEAFLASGITPLPKCKSPAPRVDYHDERTITINQRKSLVDSSAATDPFSSSNASSKMTAPERCAALINFMNRNGLFTNGFHPTRYARMNCGYVEEFLNRWEQRKETHFPVIIFHGTRIANLNSIHFGSLRAGGTKGVRVVNGTAYGNGVYSATTTNLPMCFGECGALLMCAGLVPIATVKAGSLSSYKSNIASTSHDDDDSQVYCYHDIRVFRNARDIVPLWLMHADSTFGSSSTADPLATPTELSFASLSRQLALLQYRLSQPYSATPQQSTKDAKYARYEQNLASSKEASKWEAKELQKLQGDSAISIPDQQAAQRVVNELLRGGGRSGGGFKKAALKTQPRRVKELIAQMAAEGKLK